jgi:hypothetical protein
MLMYDTHAELERLRRLRRGTHVGLCALKQLPERTPEDDLQMRSLVKLDQRLVDRIAWMEGQVEALEAEAMAEAIAAE